MNQLLDTAVPPPLSLVALAVNLVLTIVLATLVAWFYSVYGRSLSNRARFAQTLPVLALTTVLIISIIKTSLALSLGLVGALSIVRFRTAIKEPEELVYLFLSIAIGLGMGAEQQIATVVAVSVILLYLYGRTRWDGRPLRNNLYVNVVAPDHEHAFGSLSEVLARHAENTELRRIDRIGVTLQATYLIASPDDDGLATLMDAVREALPGAEISFVAQDNLLGG